MNWMGLAFAMLVSHLVGIVWGMLLYRALSEPDRPRPSGPIMRVMRSTTLQPGWGAYLAKKMREYS